MRAPEVLIYGAHPVCCGNEPIHLQNALDFAEHARELVPLALELESGFQPFCDFFSEASGLGRLGVSGFVLIHKRHCEA